MNRKAFVYRVNRKGNQRHVTLHQICPVEKEPLMHTTLYGKVRFARPFHVLDNVTFDKCIKVLEFIRSVMHQGPSLKT